MSCRRYNAVTAKFVIQPPAEPHRHLRHRRHLFPQQPPEPVSRNCFPITDCTFCHVTSILALSCSADSLSASAFARSATLSMAPGWNGSSPTFTKPAPATPAMRGVPWTIYSARNPSWPGTGPCCALDGNTVHSCGTASTQVVRVPHTPRS